MASTEHKVDDHNPHWLDFYSRNDKHIKMIQIRPNRKIAVLHIPHKDSNAPYAFFIHGSCARMGQFEALIADLRPKFHIIAFDRIGCGISAKPTAYETYSSVNIFGDLCAIFKKYIPQSSSLQHSHHSITLIGHSFGCLQAIKLLAKYGNAPHYNYLIKSVILIGAPSLCLGEKLPFVARALFSLPYWFLEKLSPSLSEGFRKNAIHSDSHHVHAVEESFSGHNKAFMFSAFYSQIIPCKEEVLETFCSHGMNVLIIHGEHDKIVPVKHGQDLFDKMRECQGKKKKNNLIEIEIVSGVSHQCMQEDPERVLKLMTYFWDKCN